MSRDGRLPRFLSYINVRTKVPECAILFVGALLVLGLAFVCHIATISSLVNFGALTSLLLLHVSVVVYFGVRRRSSNIFLHWVSPVVGFLVIGYALWNAEAAAKIGDIILTYRTSAWSRGSER